MEEVVEEVGKEVGEEVGEEVRRILGESWGILGRTLGTPIWQLIRIMKTQSPVNTNY